MGDDELIARIAGGMDFDVVVTTDMMGRVEGDGPRGLMPNPADCAPDLGKAVTEAKAAVIEYRLDKQNIIHVPVGMCILWRRSCTPT